MKSEIEIELFEEHEVVNFYTLRFKDEETEIDKFFDKFPEGCDFDDDIDIIIKWIDKIGEKGALERYLRPESKQKDDIYAIPVETSNLRLFVIRISDNILILGNGDLKSTKTYNEDPILNNIVELLKEVNHYINSRLKSQKIYFYQKQLIGDTRFYLKGNYEKE